MNIGIYSPYLDSFGGGERYMLTLASHLSRSHAVSVFWNDPDVLVESGRRFGIDLSHVIAERNIFVPGPVIRRLNESSRFDLLVILSDGSVPVHFARRAIIHFQVPFQRAAFPVWKQLLYKKVVVNSEFTAKHLDRSIVIPKTVIYPPVDPVNRNKTVVKENLILSVGRLGGTYNAKKHDILIDAFREFSRRIKPRSWKFVIAGSVLPSDKPVLELLKRRSDGLPAEVIADCPIEKLHNLFRRSAVYWHAAGYGEQSPEHMEHFGISTVEAMSAGAVPFVFNGGGLPEIISDTNNGFLWNTPGELIDKTIGLITSKRLSTVSKNAVSRANDFSVRHFTDAFDRLIEGTKS